MLAMIDAYKSGLLTRKFLMRNIFAGIVVGILASPLAIAFAIGSGAQPEQGLYTAIFSSVIIGLFGGTRVQIAGPSGTLVMMLAQVAIRYGLEGLQFVSILAGLFLIVFAIFKLGSFINLIPTNVIHAFSFGMGVSIFVNQFKDFFGLKLIIPSGVPFFYKLILLVENVHTYSINATILSILGVMILFLCAKISKNIPAPLAALSLITILNVSLGLTDVATIKNSYGGIPQTLPIFIKPIFEWNMFRELLWPSFSIAVLSSIETLLSASATDKYTGQRHRSNQELLALGFSNIISAFWGGFAATGTLTRTMTSVKCGANSPIAALSHALMIIAVLFLLAPIANAIPLCALASILYVVAFNMTNLKFLIPYLRQAKRYEVFIFMMTFLATLFLDLSKAIFIGVTLTFMEPYFYKFFKRLKEIF